MPSRKRNAAEAGMESSGPHPKAAAADHAAEIAPATPARTATCPYLDTVHRGSLDFDLPRVCKVSLSDQNVYACLVCGGFFRGRAPRSPAFLHAVDESHFVFMNLATSRAYCLPDGYEIMDRSLDDIKHELRPTFSSPEAIAQVRQSHMLKKDVNGEDYLPGYVGITNLKSTDATSVLVHALARVVPLQHFFLQDSKVLSQCRSPVVHQLAGVLRRLWNPRGFKTFVGPYELVNALAVASRNRFVVGTRPRCLHLLQWILNHMHKYIAKANGKKVGKAARQNQMLASSPLSVIAECFQGSIEETVEANPLAAQDAGTLPTPKTQRCVPFFSLSLDLPDVKSALDSQNDDGAEGEGARGASSVETVSIFDLLQKFNGEPLSGRSVTKTGPVADAPAAQNDGPKNASQQKSLRIARLPKYLFLHIRRFSRNSYVLEKNRSIVSVPLKNLDMRGYLSTTAAEQFPSSENIKSLSVSALKALIDRCGGSSVGILSREELVRVASDVCARCTKYDLVANICHQSGAAVAVTGDRENTRSLKGSGANQGVQQDPHDSGSYFIHVHHRIGRQWYKIEDSRVQEIPAELISKSESLIMLFERQDVGAN
eukprot:g3155.t1